MVQKEVKKKTSVYGIVAVLSAIVLISMVYAFGSTPVFALSTIPWQPVSNLRQVQEQQLLRLLNHHLPLE